MLNGTNLKNQLSPTAFRVLHSSLTNLYTCTLVFWIKSIFPNSSCSTFSCLVIVGLRHWFNYFFSVMLTFCKIGPTCRKAQVEQIWIGSWLMATTQTIYEPLVQCKSLSACQLQKEHILFLYRFYTRGSESMWCKARCPAKRQDSSWLVVGKMQRCE